ncbi:transmembrane GTPase Marf isoform X2 [Hyalella azteca]|uniref:Transmembrane GTPase Marf isoform X2 n=1 Tax=Hyalella azteca TaxID=294128 RepID=A0A8B7PCU9_HYAAZ|nr:transmembrane GTPase Marf isoform X2 [Hyalella azteca]
MCAMSSAVSASASMLNGAATLSNSKTNAAKNKYTLSDPSSALAASNSTSPLQIFVRAKKKINDIFQEIEEYVVETGNFIAALSKDGVLVTEKEVVTMDGYFNKVSGIKEVLARDHMKVAFFGRTSNGKSSVINAMLGDKILPSGIGHTTNCFLQVEGDESNEPFLTTEGNAERQSVSGIGQLAHALCNNRLGDSSLVTIHWPKTRCQLLRDDVVLVDSPGIDVSESLDEWIDKHCLDADVFVLVSNAESTLMNTEKNFFHKVSQRLSKPNIFILQNRWDVAASEPEYLTEVRQQHMERAVGFLCEELKVVAPQEAEQRVFFVSAKEVLQQRLADSGHQAQVTALPEGFSSRIFEFKDFERRFEECISKTAVVTKFDQHAQRGRAIANELQELLLHIQQSAGQEREQKLQQQRTLKQRLHQVTQQLDTATHVIKDNIQRIVHDIDRKVSAALNEEIRHLSALVEEFNEPFRADPLVLNVYKKTLHSHVGAGLGCNLRAKLSDVVSSNIESSQKDMTARILTLLNEEQRKLAETFLLPRREPFEVFYGLDCANLCQDFHEDIEFKFSLGVVSLVKSFMGRAACRILNVSQTENVPRGSGLTPQTPSNELPPLGVSQSDWSLISRMAVSTVGSQGSMGLVLLLGMLFKTVGWRVVGFTLTVYGGLYAYERLTWTTKAQERAFKRQYVQHATANLHRIVDVTSNNCSFQVQQELFGMMARLSRLVDESLVTMKREVRTAEQLAKQLEETASAAKTLRNKAHYLDRELGVFQETYLHTARH